jgi:hypothetical protein
MGYDQWLEEPYQEACRAEESYERAEESFRDSDNYHERFADWLEVEGNEGKTESDWEATGDYQRSVECHEECLNAPPPDYDY